MSQTHTHRHTVLISLFFYDVIIDTFTEIIYILLEFGEYSLELIIEHLFHTNHHQSELILFNTFLVFVLLTIFWVLIRFSVICTHIQAFLKHYKARKIQQWQRLSWIEKAKLSTLYIGAISLFVILNL